VTRSPVQGFEIYALPRAPRLSRRVKKVVGYPPLSELTDPQRREFHEALLGPTVSTICRGSGRLRSRRRNRSGRSSASLADLRPKALAEAPCLAKNTSLNRVTAGYANAMIGFIVAGLVIGALARLLMPGRQKIGLLWTLLLGVAGSVIGGTIANALGTGSIWELNVVGFIVAVFSALGLLVVAERSGLGQGSDRKRLGHG
jgi:uncharacterized membrane protein YeaQ/YmgE (transglycosylase-associated protein family)